MSGVQTELFIPPITGHLLDSRVSQCVINTETVICSDTGENAFYLSGIYNVASYLCPNYAVVCDTLGLKDFTCNVLDLR